MNHLFLARHGAVTETYELNDTGINEMRRTAGKITEHSRNGTYLMHSESPWVVQSLEHITDSVPNLLAEPHPKLTSSKLTTSDYDFMMKNSDAVIRHIYAKAANYDAGVILTHAEVIIYLFGFLEDKFKGNGWHYAKRPDRIETGGILHYDIQTKRVKLHYNTPKPKRY